MTTPHHPPRPAIGPRRRVATIVTIVAVALATVMATVPAGAAGQPDGATDAAGQSDGAADASGDARLIVTLEDGASATVAAAAEAVDSAVAGLAGHSRTLPRSEAMSVTVPAGEAAAARERLAARPDVAHVEPDAVVHAQAAPLELAEQAVNAARTPNDPSYANQWALPHIDAPAAWERTTGSPSVKIAVLDSGVDAGHGDLAANIGTAYNATGSGSATTDAHGHGTKAAGVAAADTDNGAGVAGVCWSCEILPVKVLADDGSGLHSDVAEGVRWAADQGADVITLSLGGHGRTVTLESAIADAVAAGSVVIASAGNYGTSEAVYPAAYDDVIGVAALDRSNQRTSYSSYGDWVSVAAPGCTITTESGGATTSFCGTSSAAPNVAGLAGLAVAHGATTPQMVSAAITDGAQSTGQGMGHGNIDADATLDLVEQGHGGGSGTDDGTNTDDGSGTDDGTNNDDGSGDGSGDDGSGTDGGADDGAGDDGYVDRVQGQNRYATAAELSAERIEPGVGRVFLATGQGYADALAAGAAAGAGDAPVLLTARDTLPSVTADELARLSPGEVVVVGGDGVVTDRVARAAGEAAGAPMTRVAGADRFATAAAIAGVSDGGTDVAYLATGEGFADALAGVPAAVVEGAPMLLSGRDQLPAATREALRQLSPQRVIVLGGESAISPRVVEQVVTDTPVGTIQRLAGADRFATAAAIADAVFADREVGEAALATGLAFPDALAAGPIAGSAGSPLLLVTRDEVPPATQEALQRLGVSQTMLLGGLSAIGDGVAGLIDGLLG